MTRILAIDPSLTGTGVARLDTDDYLVIETFTVTSKPDGDDLPSRVRRHDAVLIDVVYGDTPIDLVVIESPAYNSRDGHQHDRSGLWWRFVEYAVHGGIPVVEVVPQHIKKYATGKGNAGKEDVLLAVERRYPHARVHNNNEADAVAMVALAARGIGAPIDPWAGYRAETAARVEWPPELVVDPPRRVCQCTSDDECDHDPEE